MRKRWEYERPSKEAVGHLKQTYGLSSIISEILLKRGVRTKAEVDSFFSPSLGQLHDPFLMLHMKKAVERIELAIFKGEPILILGDYDVDGITSVASMYSLLRRFTSKIEYYIPDRQKEGYGLSLQSIDYAFQHGVKLILSLDCGTNAKESVNLAKRRGIDVIVCDHHLPDAEVAECYALLNPKQKDCPYPFKELSACGVTLKLIQAMIISRDLPKETLKTFLDLCTASIACDYVPIVGENRIITTLGLKELNRGSRVGLKALISQTSCTYPIRISDLVFGVGPLINAAGRLSDGKEAVRLLLAYDWKVASEYARLLKTRNNQRRIFDQKMLGEAIATWESTPNHADLHAIVLYKPDWHKGLLGIVAARMAERYHKPALILGAHNGMIEGSVRSAGGFDVYQVLQSCASLLNEFGGHPFAAGVSLFPQHFSALKEQFESLANNQKSLLAEQTYQIDAELHLEDISWDLFKDLQMLAPFGPGNPNPLFICRKVDIVGNAKVVKDKHLSIHIQKGSSRVWPSIGFRKSSYKQDISGNQLDICYKLAETLYKGKKLIQVQLKDVSNLFVDLVIPSESP